jgi:ElaB/YqjD/DUF883 family membrane-anchored ribosome-binding protein
MALTTLFGGLWVGYSEKVYRVETVLAPTSEEGLDSSLADLAGQYGGLATMLGVNLGSQGRAEEISIATLRSRQFASEFIMEEELLPVIFSAQWDADHREWRGRVPSLPRAVDVFGRQIQAVRQDRRSGLVHLSIEWTDRHLAAEWANKMVLRLNSRMRDQAVAEAERSIAFLSEEAGKSNLVGVQQAAYRLIESQLNRVTLARVREEYAFRVVDPALVPDERDYVRPRPFRVIVLAAGLGLSLGILLVLLRRSYEPPTQR